MLLNTIGRALIGDVKITRGSKLLWNSRLKTSYNKWLKVKYFNHYTEMLYIIFIDETSPLRKRSYCRLRSSEDQDAPSAFHIVTSPNKRTNGHTNKRSRLDQALFPSSTPSNFTFNVRNVLFTFNLSRILKEKSFLSRLSYNYKISLSDNEHKISIPNKLS